MKEVKNIRNTGNIGNIGILIILSAILALSGMAASVAATDSDFPTLQVNEFTGTVTVDGAPAPDGTTINAYVGDDLRGSVVTTTEGEYGNGQNFLIVEGTDGDDIIFKIGDSDEVAGSATWNVNSGPRAINLQIGGGGDDQQGGGDDQQGDGNHDTGSSGRSSGSGPGTLPADRSATTAPGDGEGLTPESASHEPTGADDAEGADGGAAPATEDETGSTEFLTGSGATALAVVGLLVIIALIAFVIKRRT